MIIVIVGPTGVGKTKLSLELAKRLNGEIVNADSTQIYKGLNIATAKVIDQEGIKHHLIDIKELEEDYNVYDYQKDARSIIDKLLQEKKTPIIVGGTGLYIKALLYDYQFNEEVISNNYDTYDNDTIYSMLKKVDPNTNIHKNNRKRLIRALSYYDKYKIPFSNKEKTDKKMYDFTTIGLTTKREELYELINKRVDDMITNGLVEEAKEIYESNIRTKAVMTPIGYKELFIYFEGKSNIEDAISNIKQSSRKYAKRQYTWFNNQMDINWIYVDYNNFNNTIEEALNIIKKT
jgi:tRNA dimethylallyltransferase